MTAAAPAAPDQRDVPPSALVLIAVNLIPLVGVAAFHWTVFSVLLLYWCENVVVGAFNVLRMIAASPASIATDIGKLFVIPFFIVHYGMFTAVHGVFVLALFGNGGNVAPTPAHMLAAVRGAGIGFGVAAIALSHGFSFVHNYLLGGEFRRASPALLMAQPYARVMVLHVTILAGGFVAKSLGAPTVALVILVVLKIAIDLRSHAGERDRLAVSPP